MWLVQDNKGVGAGGGAGLGGLLQGGGAEWSVIADAVLLDGLGSWLFAGYLVVGLVVGVALSRRHVQVLYAR